MKIGDKVKFLNEVGGGTVSGFDSKGQVLILCDDGFEIPMLARECILIEDQNTSITKKVEECEESGVEHPSSEPPASPIRIRDKGRSPIIALAFCPIGRELLEEMAYDAYFVNATDYNVFVALLSVQNNLSKVLFARTMESHAKTFLKRFYPKDFEEIKFLRMQMVYYKEGQSFSPKNPEDLPLRINVKKFYQPNSLEDCPFFEEPVYLYPLLTKETEENTLKDCSTGYEDGTACKSSIEIDLQGQALTCGEQKEKIQAQLRIFSQVMDKYQRHRGQRLVFIHGKGENTLRKALVKELKSKYNHCTYQDASFKDYRFGAIMVIVG